MSTLLNVIYREFCRARLAEMRQPVHLLLPFVSNDVLPY